MDDVTVPEAPDEEITEDNSLWKEGSYASYDCTYREVEEASGEYVVTKRGNRYARKGDYIVMGLDEAPQGYGSQTIARVVRKDDDNLSLSRKAQA